MKTKNALNGINGLEGLGALSPNLIATILTNKFVIEKVLKHSSNLKGLGFVEGKKVGFADVVKMYNEGISESEIKAWIWYKQKQGVPMKHWSKHYKVTGMDIPKLVQAQKSAIHCRLGRANSGRHRAAECQN